MATTGAYAVRPSLQACCASANLEAKVPPSLKGKTLSPSRAASSPVKLVSTGSRVCTSEKEDRDSLKVCSTAAAVAVLLAAVAPEFAEAAQPGVSASLRNLLLSVVAGGAVLAALGSAVVAVAKFDPVQRK